MINKKYALIVKYLNERNEYVTSNELAVLLKVSTKTITRYIDDINYYIKNYNVEICSSRGMGYKIIGSRNNINKVVNEAKKYIDELSDDDSYDSRIRNIICIFINNRFITAEKIADELNLSIGSTNKLISEVKRKINKYDLKIKSKPYYGSYIEGDEVDIRSLITDYAIKSNNKNKIKVFLNNISTKDIQCIEDFLSYHLKKKNIIISDKDFYFILSRIIASISRVKSGYYFNIDKSKYIKKSNNFYLIKEIMSDIFEKIGLDLTPNEVIYITSYSSVINNSLFDDALHTKEEYKVKRLVNEALNDIFLISGIDYSKDEEFMKGLLVHVHRFINRFKIEIDSKNPLLNQIKSEFPLEFNFAIFIANKINDEFGVKLDEGELGYIAIHFAAGNERIKNNTSKKICIICHYGVGTAQLIAEKLKQNLREVNIMGIYPSKYLDIALKQDVDLIVSTVDIKSKEIPIVYIDNIFNNNFINDVNETLFEKDTKKNVINKMFNKEAFFKIKNGNKEDIINMMCKNLKNKGFIDEGMIEGILSRERIYSTEIGNSVALPHTIISGKKSIIGVTILDQPILWDKQEIQLIFMVFFNPEEKSNFSIFKYLYNFIKDKSIVREAIKCDNIENLKKLI